MPFALLIFFFVSLEEIERTGGRGEGVLDEESTNKPTQIKFQFIWLPIL